MVYYRAGYHHGDARAALVRAAFNLACGGGPRTVTLRAAAREVGITAAAVYRHFRTAEELLGAVKCRALLMLGERVDDAVARVAAGGDAALRKRIRAVAEAYVSFARENPGLFAMAGHGGFDDAVALVGERVGDVPHTVGLAVWSAAHGVAVVSGSEVEQQRVLDIVLAGIVPG
ncbi:MAG: TetR/AcrR family transcriptional regulator [Catenulispora sp.]